MQIGRKIYYEQSTGNVIVNTGERSGSVIPTTTEQDFESYAALAERVPESVGVIELEYGQYLQDFAQCRGYKVNIESNELEFEYPDPNNPNQPPVYQKPLTVQVSELKADNLTLMEAIADLYELVAI